MATIIGLSSGWMYSSTGVPTRSWGRYPRRGTARSSTSWNRQLGVWLVVNILLSGGMRGAERASESKTKIRKAFLFFYQFISKCGEKLQQQQQQQKKYPHILSALSLRWVDSRVVGKPCQSLVVWAGRGSVWTGSTLHHHWMRRLHWCDKTWTFLGCSPLVERLERERENVVRMFSFGWTIPLRSKALWHFPVTVTCHNATKIHLTQTYQSRCRRPMAAVCRVRCCCRRCSHLVGPAAQKTKHRAASLAYYAEEMSPAVRCTQLSLTGTTPPWKMCPAQDKRLFCNFLQNTVHCQWTAGLYSFCSNSYTVILFL